MKRILRYLRARRFSRDLEAETQAHVDEKTEELISAGRTPGEARAEAQRTFGNRTRIAEESREQWAFAWLDELGQDLRFAARVLRKNPVFTGVAVFSLALGIGANTVIFSGVNHVLLSPLAYPEAGRLYAVWGRSAAHGAENMFVSPADFYDWRAQSRTFDGLAAYTSWPENLTDVEEPRRLECELVSANFFATLEVQAQVGRTFRADEDQEQSPFVVVISHHLWRELGESPQMIGRQLRLNGSQATVVGVMPPGFGFPSPRVDAWAPLSLSAKNRASREGRWLTVIGRLRPGAQERVASTELNVVASRLAAVYPATNAGWSVSLTPLQDEIVGKTRPILLTLQAGALLLLLTTCANLANLLLARGAARTREITVRAALGAGRARILRQLSVESALLAVIGGAAGLGLAFEGIHLVRAFGEGLIPRASEIHLSGAVALFAVAATIVTAMIFGFMPAMHVSRGDLAAKIQSGARGTERHVERRRGVLIALEVGLATMLLVGAGLLGESLLRLLATPAGMRTDHLLTVRLTLVHAKYPTNAAQVRFFEQALESVRGVPGVLAAAAISDTPLEGNNPTFEFVLDGVVRRASDSPVQAGLRVVSAAYLQTAGIPVIRGRGFTAYDREGSPPVVVVNESMARRYWGAENPVGRRLRFKDDERWLTVRGVVPDVKHMGLKAEEGPAVYIPYAQKTQDWLAWTTMVARTGGDPMTLLPAVRDAIRAVDRNQALGEAGPLEDVLVRSTAMPRFTTAVIVALSGFALLIAVVGVYGLLAYTLAQRMPELGIRLTLGASPRQVAGLLLRQAMLRVLGGIAGGLLGAWWLARGMESLLFGVRPHDAGTFLGAAALIAVASLTAVLVPAKRAAQIDPTAALRAE